MGTGPDAGIGAAVRHFREVRGWKREDLAVHARVGYQTICQVEQGHRLPSVPRLVALAKALDVTIDQLVYFEGPQGDITRTEPGLSAVEVAA